LNYQSEAGNSLIAGYICGNLDSINLLNICDGLVKTIKLVICHLERKREILIISV